MSNEDITPLAQARDEFVSQWGAIGNAWGINRTMSQIHALLITAPFAMTTDEVMEELKISRGNANGNLRELVSWGLIRSVVRKGERKEYFEAEKDVWKMFCTITRERRRREISPAIEVLQNVADKTEALEGTEAAQFTAQMNALLNFLQTADNVMEKVARADQSVVLPWALKFLK
ncbi:MAG TPA: transcriptional regulator [Chthoniobacterales bacterium]|jgi:DNA-binding transcriptional regulator GbsR (MarR family)